MKSTHLFTLILLSVCLLYTFSPVHADNIAAITHYNRAVDLAYEGKYSDSLNETDLALQENPNFTLAWINRAGVLIQLGAYQDALDATDHALAMNPDQADAWTNRATALIRLGRAEEALNASERAIGIDPNLSEAWIDKGSALIALQRYWEAYAATEKALQLNPGSPEALKNMRDLRILLNIAEPIVPTTTPTQAGTPGFLTLFAITLFIALGCLGRKPG